jgi:hypothetical protein
MYTENTDVSVFEAIARTILETGNNRVLTFHSRSETSSETRTNVNEFSTSSNKNEFIKCFKKILTKEFPHLKGKYKTSDIELIGITAKTKDRQEILKKFESTLDNEICVLSSCKTIGEGVDTKKANMVVFVDPKQSYVEIIQNIGRICRKQNKLSTVLIPVHVDVKKYKECITEEDTDKVIRQEMSKTGDFNGILNVLSALRQEDPYLFELCLKYPETYTKKEIEQNLKNNGLKLDDKEYTNTALFHKYKLKYNQNKTETENFTNLSKLIKKNIQITNDKVLEEDIFIEYTDNTTDIKTEYIVKIADKYQTTISNKDTIKKISKPNRNIKPIIHTNDDIKVIWKITSDINSDKKMFGGYIEATIKPGTEEYWFEMLNNVKLYIDKNNMRPISSDKNPQIKQMGIWISNQIQNYKKNIGLIKIKKIKKYWEKFINDYRQYFLSNIEVWESKLSEVKEHINKNKSRPSTGNKDLNIERLANWISEQLQNYQKKTRIMSNSEIYNKWTEFINNPQYSEYFLSNEDIWNRKLNDVKSYIDLFKKRPSENDIDSNIRSLCSWICNQQQNYKKKSTIMLNPEIYDKWTKFTNDPLYLRYFLSNEDFWNTQLNEVKIYINQNKKRPSSTSKNLNTQILGAWIGTQQHKYKNKIQIMSNQEIYNKWTEFINDPQYFTYLLSNIEVWEDKFNEVKIYINKYKTRPSSCDENSNIKKLALWLNSQQGNYKQKKDIMSNEKIYDKWTDFINDPQYLQYFLSNEEVWEAKLNEVKEYIDQNKKRPSYHDKDNKIKKLGMWICNQQINYQNKTQIMSNPEIYNKWTNFINDTRCVKYFSPDEERWDIKLNELKTYIDQNKKRPPQHSKDTKIEKLAVWISNQQSNYQNKTQIMAILEIYNKWTEFINDPLYSEYFLSNEKIWEDKLNELKIYIEQNKKRPSSEDKDTKIRTLGSWVSNQQGNYKNKKCIMTNIDIYNKWTNFINDSLYLEYLLSNEETWESKLNEVKIYIDQNKKLPISCGANIKIKSLGVWIGRQKDNYIHKKEGMSKQEIYDKWTEFINNPLYSEYLISNEEAWKAKLIELKTYINYAKRRPSKRDVDNKIKSLGIWIGTQLPNYQKKTCIMSNPEIYAQWTEFIKDPQYSKYFTTETPCRNPCIKIDNY